MNIVEKLDLAIKLKETGTTDGAYVVELGNGKKHTKKTYMTKEEWNLFERDSRIMVSGQTVGHPFEANIWQLELEDQVSILSSIAKAGCNSGEPMPEKFKDWIVWKLGDKIAEMYMLPYNQKMFSDELDELGTYWLEKLPNVSFEDTLRSCLCHKAYGQQPGHASFYYPKKYGYGEVWLRMADALSSKIIYQEEVSGLDCNIRIVTTKSGESYVAEKIITTIPWRCFETIQGMPQELIAAIKNLKSSAIETRYVPEQLDTPAQWIYVPDEKIPYHRILVRHNFCPESKGYWLETRKERVELFDEEEAYSYMNEYAYPLNTIGKQEIMCDLLDYCKEKHIYGLGRWGEHCHYNSDLVVELAMNLAGEI